MSHLSIIEKTKYPNTIDTLCTYLKALGISEGDTLIVHSSLSEIGWVCGGPTAVFTALLKTVGTNGTIAMPAFSLTNSDPAEWPDFISGKSEMERGNLLPYSVPAAWHETIRENMPAYDKNITPRSRGIGTIAESFRTYPETYRSEHPSASFTANGYHSRQIVSQHKLSPCFDMDSPLGALYQIDAKVLLLGVGYDRCTSSHLAETLSGRLKKIRHGSAMTENGKRTWKWFEDYDSDSDNCFPALGQAYELTNSSAISSGKVGAADCKLIELRSAVDFGVKWIKRLTNQAKINTL